MISKSLKEVVNLNYPYTQLNKTCIAGEDCHNLSITQPSRLILPNGLGKTNPYYDSIENISYWSYDILIGYGDSDSFSNIYLPICLSCSAESMLVEEKILSLGDYTPVPFTLVSSREGYKESAFIKIPILGRYPQGALVSYRLKIKGEYLFGKGSPVLETDESKTYNFDEVYDFPIKFLHEGLFISKSSETIAENNKCKIVYNVTLTNGGSIDFEDIIYVDQINYNSNCLTLGEISIGHSNISLDRSIPGLLCISGTIDSLKLGESIVISYTVDILSVSSPGIYNFLSRTSVSSMNHSHTITSNAFVEAVELTIDNLTSVSSESSADFILSITPVANSPVSSVEITSILSIPSSVILNFSTFSGCTAIFIDTQEPVPIHTDISGKKILITCSQNIPPGITTNFIFSMDFISITDFNPTKSPITNTLQKVVLSSPQMFIGSKILSPSANLFSGGLLIL